jgi:hypothetical protein
MHVGYLGVGNMGKPQGYTCNRDHPAASLSRRLRLPDLLDAAGLDTRLADQLKRTLDELPLSLGQELGMKFAAEFARG